MLNLVHMMTELAQRRPVFHSEADFQHALAWQIHEHYPDAEVRLEYRLAHQGNPMYLDVWITRLGHVAALELKYYTAGARFNVESEVFDLRDQSAQDLGRYDLLKDVSRLERTVRGLPSAVGYAILLTNDSLYWTEPQPRRGGTIFEAFRIHEGREVRGELAWAPRAGEGTTKGRADPIRLAGSYTMVWRDYSSPTEERNGLFRYLLIEVRRDDFILDVRL